MNDRRKFPVVTVGSDRIREIPRGAYLFVFVIGRGPVVACWLVLNAFVLSSLFYRVVRRPMKC
jgi:hypothetical protein